MSGRDLNLDGTEISVIKALGVGGAGLNGADLLGRVQGLEAAEVMDTLKGLIAQGLVDADKTAFYSSEEMAQIHFQVNTGYIKELREALNPQPDKGRSKRVRRE